MEPAEIILIWAILFVATHLVISSSAVRPRLIDAIGAQPYRGIYALVSLVTFIGMCVEFGLHKHAGVMLWNLRSAPPVRWLAWLLMLLALITIAAGLMNPSPAAIAARGKTGAPSGIQKVTRHPSFVAFTLFGVAHLLMNGFVGDIFFFGAFPALGILGGWHQDARKRAEIGAAYDDFVATTSFFPAAALVSGRAHLSRAEIPWRAIIVGVILTVILIAVHPLLFGGHPLG